MCSFPHTLCTYSLQYLGPSSPVCLFVLHEKLQNIDNITQFLIASYFTMHYSNNIYMLLGALSSMGACNILSRRSQPFNLIVRSTNATLDGCVLSHLEDNTIPISMNIFGLSYGPDSSVSKTLIGDASLSTYYMDYSGHSSLGGYIISGTLDAGLLLTVLTNPTSNVVIPAFFPIFPSNGLSPCQKDFDSNRGGINVQNCCQEVAFDDRGRMNIQGVDTSKPVKNVPDIVLKEYYRW